MKRRYVAVMVLGVLIFTSNQMAQAQNMKAGMKAPVQAGKPRNVGNKICPVSGEKVDSMTPVTYEYEGKIFNLCCTACIKEFKKDPKKYIKKVAEELLAESIKK